MRARRPNTVRDLRRGSRSTLLSALYFDGPQSRQELILATGFSSASVSNVTGELIEAGAIVEAGAIDSDGGRPRTLLQVNPDRYVVGLSVGPKRMVAGLFDLAMRARSTVTVPHSEGAHDPGEVVQRILVAVGKVVRDAGVDASRLLGIGLGVPGVVEHGAELRVSDQTLGWAGVPLERLLRDGTELPLFVDNGAKNMGQAEMWFGAGRGVREAVIVLIGSGAGAAIVSGGGIYQGASSSAGEWGHTIVEVGGRRCRCGARGCLEAYVGAEAIIDRYHQLTGLRRAPGLDEEAELDRLMRAAPDDDVAGRVLEETALYLGVGVANLINLINPERIVIGGWAGLLLGNRLLDSIRAVARENALRSPYDHTTIELARLGVDADILGAATLPIAEFLRSGGDASASRPVSAAPGPAALWLDA
ncbi:ROK family protein [Dactylosporangium sp. CA-152071]|uniref:ROK family protein n=1 Tax=Dactylosporangium sp. CA-152071 TaxID=3239933 RepID=UPI003D8D422B